jgi:diguanylate cyclase (GGDEF)-like protein
MLDMDARLAPVRRTALIFLSLVALAQAHWLGIWTLAPIAVAAVVFAAGARLSGEAARPEFVLFGSWVVSELVIAATVVIAGVESTLLAWLAIPVVTLSARFSTSGVLAGVAIALALCVGVAFATDAEAVLDYPPLLLGPAAVIVAVGILSTALMRSDFAHRGEAVIDPLTGMLNRNALIRRASELEEQSRVANEPVAMVVGDLDDFKRINDTLGHQAGDAVLAQVAYALRKHLRAFDLVYRFGGDEFLVLIPGGTVDDAREIAGELCRAIATAEFEGERMTMSVGVSATAPGERFDYETQFERADAALYAAKHDGRDRVVVAAN